MTRRIPPRAVRAARAGYTLIELCVTAIATILLMGVVYNLFTHNVYEGVKTEAQGDLSADARMAMHRLTIDVKRAHAVSTESGKLKISAFTGRPRVGYPNNGLQAAQVEQIEYYLEKSDLVRNNLTTHRKDVVAKNVISFRPVAGKGVVALQLEAEVEVVIERQKYDKVRIALLEKVHPVHLSERAKYKGYFCSVDEDGTY